MTTANKGFNSFSHKADSDKNNSEVLQASEKVNEHSPQNVPTQPKATPASEQKDKGVQPNHNTPKSNPK
ncbi:hypothetical protein OK024_01520 [Acinetobacter sp. UGAL515B_02]|nr:hypothetical protein [Acinetobacter sp. UGAL515B_02]WON80550.1 hypothetical protein OK024_01520 [Acinetobacter sp. UGAL515B_02]